MITFEFVMGGHSQRAQNGAISHTFLHNFVSSNVSGNIWIPVDEVLFVKNIYSPIPFTEFLHLFLGQTQHALWVYVQFTRINVGEA